MASPSAPIWPRETRLIFLNLSEHCFKKETNPCLRYLSEVLHHSDRTVRAKVLCHYRAVVLKLVVLWSPAPGYIWQPLETCWVVTVWEEGRTPLASSEYRPGMLLQCQLSEESSIPNAKRAEPERPCSRPYEMCDLEAAVSGHQGQVTLLLLGLGGDEERSQTPIAGLSLEFEPKEVVDFG